MSYFEDIMSSKYDTGGGTNLDILTMLRYSGLCRQNKHGANMEDP